jgi:serine/threonine protein kinase
MNILCPSCHSSIPVSETDPLLRCGSCGLTTDLSSIGTYPGGAGVPMVRDLSGETIDGYRVDELIGVGGMGVVYKAERVDDGGTVAIKVLHPSYVWNREEFVARFAREARALARLEHPGIVRILRSGQQGDLYYLVTEYVEGADLARHLRTQRPSLPEIVAIMIRVCEAIGYAHDNGVVHRDIKPANIMISGDSIRVLDFGLAQIAGGDTNLSSLTRTDLAMGTFNYLSPEQRTNAKQVDQRSDVFSLGVVFFELLTGTLPLGNFAPPSRARAEAGKLCDRIVSRSLSADPADRYQSVAEMIADLRLVRARPGGRRKAFVAVAAGLAGVAAAVVLAYGLGMFDEPADDGAGEPAVTEGKAERGQIPPFVDVGHRPPRCPLRTPWPTTRRPSPSRSIPSS